MRVNIQHRAPAAARKPAGRMSTDVNSAARIPRLAHPKLRTTPRDGAALRGPDTGHGKRFGTHQELFKRKVGLEMVICISGHAEESVRDKIGSWDDILVLPKPYSLNQLAGLVRDAIGAGKRAA